MVGNPFPRGIRELAVKLADGGVIPARIGGSLGDFCKRRDPIRTENCSRGGDPWRWGETIPAGIRDHS